MHYVLVMENFPIVVRETRKANHTPCVDYIALFKIKRTVLSLNNLNTCMWDSIQIHYSISLDA